MRFLLKNYFKSCLLTIKSLTCYWKLFFSPKLSLYIDTNNGRVNNKQYPKQVILKIAVNDFHGQTLGNVFLEKHIKKVGSDIFVDYANIVGTMPTCNHKAKFHRWSSVLMRNRLLQIFTILCRKRLFLRIVSYWHNKYTLHSLCAAHL